MRVLMLASANTVHTVRWTNGLASKGCEVHLAYLPAHSPSRGEIDDRVVLHQMKGRGSGAYFSQSGAVRRLWRTIQPDIVHAHYASGYGTLLRLAHAPRTMLSAWGSDVYEFPERGPLQRALVRANLRAADCVTSSSNIMAERIHQLAGRPVETVAFGVDLSTFAAPERRPPIGPVTFGIVKTMEPHYRIDVILRAYAEYSKLAGSPRSTLEIYGKGSQLYDLKRLASDLEIAHSVRFHGAVPHDAVPRVLREMDVFLLASDTESFGVAAIEAMAAGLPLIASDAPGFIEVSDGGRFGQLFPRGDHHRLAQLMHEVAVSTHKWCDLSRAALEGAQRYSWEESIVSMLKLYQQLAGAR